MERAGSSHSLHDLLKFPTTQFDFGLSSPAMTLSEIELSFATFQLNREIRIFYVPDANGMNP